MRARVLCCCCVCVGFWVLGLKHAGIGPVLLLCLCRVWGLGFKACGYRVVELCLEW